MKHIFLFATLVLFAGCGHQPQELGSPATVLLELTNNERYIEIDQVADLMINKDPSLLLIDVRDHSDFDAFTLPGAVNMPLKEVLQPGNQTLLDCERFNIVFFSNDDLLAEQVWMANQHNCEGAYILKGGLNEWTASILDLQKPEETATAEEIEQYQFRKAVCQYFIGGSEELEPERYQVIRQPVAIKKTIPLKSKKKAAKEEGC